MVKKIKKLVFKIFLILIILGMAGVCLYIGFYLDKVSKKSYVFGVAIDKIFGKVEDVYSMNNKYELGDIFSISGDVDLELNSEDYVAKSKVDSEYLKKNNLLKNLTSMDIKYEIMQDKSKGRFYTSLDEKNGKSTIFSGKYLIDNSTKYFIIDGLLKNYVNDGGSSYFESLTEKSTTDDNILYVYNFIRDSLKRNILDSDLNGYDVETNIGNERRKVSQISYKITDKSIKQVLEGVLKDLKKDKKCKDVIGGLYSDFSNWKVDKNKKYLNSNESYTINIYTQKIINTPLKYEIVYLVDDQKEIYTYEGNEDEGVFYYTLNNEVKYNAIYESNEKQVIVNVTDRKNNSVGIIKVEKDINNFIFNLTLDLESDKYDISYSRKFSNFEKDKGYDREDIASFKIMKDMVNKINGNVKVTSKVSYNVKIDEDISDAVLKSTLSAEENKKIENLQDDIRTILEK